MHLQAAGYPGCAHIQPQIHLLFERSRLLKSTISSDFSDCA
jgi:hypothetical protein